MPPTGPARWEERGERRWDDGVDESGGAPRTSGKAVASMVIGIVSLCLPVLIPAVIAGILGIVGLQEISQGRGRVTGRGFAIAGIVMAVLSIVLIPVMLVAMLVPAVQRVRSGVKRTAASNNVRQIALAMHNYNDVHGQLPPSVVYDKDGKPLYSWRVLLLPYLEEERLYRQLHLDEPWDSAHNKTLLSQMPRVYASPTDGWPPAEFKTHYVVFDGPGAPWDSGVEQRRQRPSGQGLRPFEPAPGITVYHSGKIPTIPATFTDGTSNTIMIVEADDAVPWTKPEDLPYSANGPLPKLGGLYGSGQFLVGMGDASVRSVYRKGLSDATLRAAITPNGNEILGPDWAEK